MSQTAKIVVGGIAVLLIVAIAVLGYMATWSTEPIETEQASEEYPSEEEATEEEEETALEEEASEETTVATVRVVYIDPEPSEEAEASAPSGLTPEQQENRRIYEERSKTYDGTGPSPWVQGQIDWAREQGLLPNASAPTSLCHKDRSACSGPGIQTEQEMEEHVAQSKAANQGQGEGANMCGIKPDATLYGKPC